MCQLFIRRQTLVRYVCANDSRGMQANRILYLAWLEYASEFAANITQQYV